MIAPRRHIIYGLFDPRNGELRYVGKSSKGLVRVASHLCPSSLRPQTLKNGWLKSLLKRGLRPEATEIEVLATEAELNDAERHQIANFKALGCRLTNMTPGGDGQLGVPCPPERREKISAAQRGKPRRKHTEEWKRLASIRMQGHQISPEARERGAAKRRGKRMAPEAVAAMTARARQLATDPQHLLKISRAHGGRPFIDHRGRRYETINGAARALGISAGHICQVLKRQRNSAGGLIFTYVEE